MRSSEDTLELDRDLRAQEESTFMLTTLASYEGRAILWSLMDFCKIHESTFTGESTHLTAFNEGRRSVGLTLRNWVADIGSKDILATLEREHENRQEIYRKMEDERELEDE